MPEQRTDANDKPRRRLKAAERRESILAAAVGIFAEFGYQQTKTAAIAERVGVSEPVVFQHFDSKAELFAAVIRRATDQVCSVVRLSVEQQLPVRELLVMVLGQGHLAHIHAAGSIGAIFANATAVTGEPAITAAARESTQRFAAVVTELLERGKNAGQLRADLDTEAAAWWLLSMAASQPFRAATAADTSDIEARLGRATFAFLTGETM